MVILGKISQGLTSAQLFAILLSYSAESSYHSHNTTDRMSCHLEHQVKSVLTGDQGYQQLKVFGNLMP